MDGIQLFDCIFNCYNGNFGALLYRSVKIYIAGFYATFFHNDNLCLYGKAVYFEKTANDEKVVFMDAIDRVINRLCLFCEMGWFIYHSCSWSLHMYRIVFALL